MMRGIGVDSGYGQAEFSLQNEDFPVSKALMSR
jgi:hypothetical protein